MNLCKRLLFIIATLLLLSVECFASAASSFQNSGLAPAFNTLWPSILHFARMAVILSIVLTWVMLLITKDVERFKKRMFLNVIGFMLIFFAPWFVTIIYNANVGQFFGTLPGYKG